MSLIRKSGVVLLLVLFSLPALLAPRNFPTDDSLFYLQVARHIASGNGSTFDTMTVTNGYHPLWMAPCVAAAWLSGGDSTVMLRIVFVMQQWLTVGALWLFHRLTLRLGIRSWAAGVPLVGIFFLTGLYASEAHLNGFCILASLLMLVRFAGEPTPWNGARLGVSLGATVLARLDNVLLVGAILVGAAIWIASRTPRRLRSLGVAMMPISLIVAPYLFWNLATFGHLMPISGAIKTTFPRIYGDLRNLGVLGLSTFATALLGGVGLLLKGVAPLRRLVLGSMAVGVVAQALYITLYTDHNTHWSWYYVPGVLLAALLACVTADHLGTRFPRLATRFLAVVAIALVLTWGLVRVWARFANSRASSHNQFLFQILAPARAPRWEVQFARYLESALPPQAGVLAFDYPGALAFYSSLRIIPADGLIGGYTYDTEVREKGLAAYLAAHNVGYYFGELTEPPDSCRTEAIFAPIERTDVGSMILCPQNLVATSGQVVRDVPAPAVGLYRIREVAPPRDAPRERMKKHGLLW